MFLAIFSFGAGLSALNTYVVPNKDQYVGMVIESKENYFLFQSGFNRFYVYEKENTREVGDWLVIDSKPTEVSFLTYESQFNMKEYLSTKGVKYSLGNKYIVERVHMFLRIKEYKSKFLSRFDSETAALIDALLFGTKHYDARVTNQVEALNLIHLLSFSGIYLNFLILIVRRLLLRFVSEKALDIVPYVVLTPLIYVTFPKIGLIRVILTGYLRFLNRYVLKTNLRAPVVTSICAILLLLFDFRLAYQSSYFIPIFLSLLLYYIGAINASKRKIKKSLSTLLFIYLFMIPVSTLDRGCLHLFTFVFQFILIPFHELYLVISLVSLSTFPFRYVLGFLTNIADKIYTFLGYIDISIPLGNFGIYFNTLYYVLLVFGLMFYESQNKEMLKIFRYTVITMVLISILPIRTYLINAVYFINVGQGDSILLQNRDKTVLIDTGGNMNVDLATETLIPFLKKKQIYDIDLLVTTHDDYDHSGAVDSLMRNFKVKQYLKEATNFPVQVGQIFLENLNHLNAADENESSLVFNVNFMHKKFLLMGDANIAVEKFLIDGNYDIDCDILKVGHHGSKTSSCEEFILKCSPIEAIISCGANNKYGHPNKEVIETLNKYNVSIRRTDLEGTISYFSIF